MTTSPDLGLPYIANQQSQPEVTHNEALNMLAVAMKGAIDRGLNTPPGSPTNGDVYIVGTSPTGAWAGRANKIAIRTDNAWTFVPGLDSTGTNIPIGARHEGLRIWVQDEDALYVWNGSSWVLAPLQLQSHTVGALPSASTAGQLIYVSDGASNKRLAVSDGTNWRWPDGSIPS